MNYNENWSKERQDNSVEILFNGACMEPCYVKHWRSENRYGTVSVVAGISKGEWAVKTENGEIEKFDTVEDLVFAGWVVD